MIATTGYRVFTLFSYAVRYVARYTCIYSHLLNLSLSIIAIIKAWKSLKDEKKCMEVLCCSFDLISHMQPPFQSYSHLPAPG